MRGRSRGLRALWGIAFGAMVLLPVACGSPSSASNNGGSGTNANATVTIGLPEEPDTLDPQRSNAAATGDILDVAGNALVAQNPQGKIVPDLAGSWTTSSDGLHWAFNLIHGASFQNGDPVDAQTVVASFQRAMNPATQPGAIAALLAPVADVKATGQYQVTFDLKQQYSPFLTNLASGNASIVDAAVAAKEGSQFGRAPVLTGPYRITSWQAGTSITLVRNSAYHWGPSYQHQGPGYIKSLVFRIITDDSTMAAAIQSGEVQSTYSLSTAKVKQFQGSSQFHLFHYLRKGVGLYLEFNVNKAPFNDVKVRQALNYAIDKQAIIKVALQGMGVPACGPLPSSIPGYWSGICNYGPKYDPAKAKQLLGEAGWTPGPGGVLQKDGQPFQFTVSTMATPSSWNDSAQLLQQQLKAIGINMQIQNYEFATLLARAEAGQDAAHLMGYTYTDPDILYLLFDSQAGSEGINLSHVSDPKLDQMLQQYREQQSLQQQNQTYEEIQKYVVDQGIQVPLWVNQNYGVTASNLQDVKLNFQGLPIWQDVKVS
ncbi:MAG: ABC transporter substrate-binding protein [Candidatus Dormiibacterota bacterium]